MNELHLFAGAGGGILAGQLLGHRCIGAVEIDAHCQKVLLARQRDRSLPEFPIFSDVRTFDGRPYRGHADILAGGFPCQDISVAGKGAGIDGDRSGLWSEMARIGSEIRPYLFWLENSPAIVVRGLDRVLSDLAALRYDCRWTVLGAADVGAPHQRDRFWLLAADRDREQLWKLSGWQRGSRWPEEPAEPTHDGETQPLADSHQREREQRGQVGRVGRQSLAGSYAHPSFTRGDWWAAEPGVGRVVHGVAHRMDRLRAIGNGQVPAVAAAAFLHLAKQFK